jgi:Abortive infection C-terminus
MVPVTPSFFRLSILGNCKSVVNLGALRNKIGDAHGQGKLAIKPKPRHPELAVNLARTWRPFSYRPGMKRQRPVSH